MKQAKQRHWITRADKQPDRQQAAGVVMMHAGKVLLLRRSGEGIWGLPGGGIEEGETPADAALRECDEEIGFRPSGTLSEVSRTDKHGADFTTFFAHHNEAQDATLNDEHEAAAWVALDKLHKYKTHPGVSEVLGSAFRQDAEDFESHFGRQPETETQVAQAMREGELQSPQHFANITFFDIRITGTGVSVRLGKDDTDNDEYVLRKPELYLTDEFLARCNGLPVILEHPETDTLDSKEFSTRIIGTIVLPYIKGNEVWGIAKIYDAAAAKLMAERKLSTSPSVAFFDGNANKEIPLEKGAHLLIEGNPNLVDHIAVVINGVWDKGSGPTGVKTTRADAQNERSSIMAEMGEEAQAKKDAETGDSMSKMMEMLSGLVKDVGEMKSKIAQLEAAEEHEAGEAAADAGSASSMPSPEKAGAEEEAPQPEAVPDNAKPSEELKEMGKRVDALEAASKPREEEEEAKMADAQARADAAYSAHGKRAPAPLAGETLLNYRKRLAVGMQPHSESVKGINIRSISDSAALGLIEKSLYEDAKAAAAKAAAPAPGTLFQTVRKDATGRQIIEFTGDPKACWAPFMAPTQRVTRFVTKH
jgi:8-oxo-dGTP pyrophosphatase MutT (NUDIX family)